MKVRDFDELKNKLVNFKYSDTEESLSDIRDMEVLFGDYEWCKDEEFAKIKEDIFYRIAVGNFLKWMTKIWF